MLWSGNIQTPVGSGHGNGCFQRRNITPIGLPERGAGTIFMSRFCNERFETRWSRLAYPSQPAVTPFAVLRHNNHLFNFLYFIGNSCCPTTVGGNFFPRFTPSIAAFTAADSKAFS